MRKDRIDEICIPGMEPEDVPTTTADRITARCYPADLARYCRCTTSSVYRWIVTGRVPQPTYDAAGRRCWWDLAEVLRWVESAPAPLGTYPRLTKSGAAKRAEAMHHALRLRVAEEQKAHNRMLKEKRQRAKIRKPVQPQLPPHQPAPKRGRKGVR